MFYKSKLSKKRKVLYAVICLLIFSVWGTLVFIVNSEYPDKTIIECRYGEWIDYEPDVEGVIKANVSLSPLSCDIATGQELVEQYTESLKYSYIFNEREYFVFEIAIKNNVDTAANVRKLAAYFMFCSPENGSSNALLYLNDEIAEVQAKETVTVRFATLFNYLDALPNSYERFMNSDIYVLISNYPIERRLVFRADNH